MFAHPQRLVGRNAAVGTFLCRSPRIDSDEVRSLAVALVFHHSQERAPRRTGAVSAVRWEFHKPLGIEIFDRDEAVLPSVVRRELV